MLVDLFVILVDVAFTVLITFFFVPTGHYYHYWAPFLLLIAGYLVGMALGWITLSIIAQFYSKNKEYKKPSKAALFWLSQSIGYINHHSGARMKVIYHEPLPKERFLLVCNHLSKFDPMLLAEKYGHKLGLSFISKPSNFKIPIGGHFMKASCYLGIEREDKLKSLQTMNEATRLISEDLSSIGVYPEGARQKTPEDLAEFHEGVFAIAQKANCPIVITSIKGSEKIHKNFPWKFTKVKFQVIKVLYPSDYQGMTSKAISLKARSLIEESLQ